MKIGFDIDGVLANFFVGYENLVLEVAGKDLFPARYPVIEPPCWNWPEHYGYSHEVMKEVWSRIKHKPYFWHGLKPLPGVSAVRLIDPLEHDLYFITDRPGQGAKRWTEKWLYNHDIHGSAIISSSGKGVLVAGLGLELYIDDKPENILDVQAKAPNCRAYLGPAYAYNSNHSYIKRTARSVKEMLQLEGLLPAFLNSPPEAAV